MRGEYKPKGVKATIQWELPPRARRILDNPIPVITPVGTTSACAENTFRDVLVASRKRNYLRVRGEYRSLTFPAKNGMELPPRARRILTAVARAALNAGTTSACAENTIDPGEAIVRERNYLRVRGEYY